MKKILAYSFLFACLALNPLPIKADTPKSAISVLNSAVNALNNYDIVSAIVLGSTAGSTVIFGMGSLLFFKESLYWFKEYTKYRNENLRYTAEARVASGIHIPIPEGADIAQSASSFASQECKFVPWFCKIDAPHFKATCNSRSDLFSRSKYIRYIRLSPL